MMLLLWLDQAVHLVNLRPPVPPTPAPAAGQGVVAAGTNWFQWVALLLGAGGLVTGVGAFLLTPANRRKIQAETAEKLSLNALKQAEMSEAARKEMLSEVAVVKKDSAAAEKRAETAEKRARKAEDDTWKITRRAERAEVELTELRVEATEATRASQVAVEAANALRAEVREVRAELTRKETEWTELLGLVRSSCDNPPVCLAFRQARTAARD
jgi:hypothetical protein